MKKNIMLIVLLILVIGTTGCQQKKSYPNKSIEFLVPAAAGSALDLYTRGIDEACNFGVSTNIVNMAGASQTIGISKLKSCANDGYTIGIAGYAGIITQPNLTQLSYKLDDFRYIVNLSGSTASIILVSPDSGITSINDLVDKISSGENLKWSSPNVASSAQVSTYYTFDKLGINTNKLSYVAYNGSAEAVTALLGKHIDFIAVGTDALGDYVKSGQLTPILLLKDEADEKNFPGVPAGKDIGVQDLDALNSSTFVIVKKDTPDKIVDIIKDTLNKAIQSEEYQKVLQRLGIDYKDPMSEEDLTNTIYKASDIYKKVMKEFIQ